MFSLNPRKAVKKAARRQSRALMAPSYSPFRTAFFPEFNRLFEQFCQEMELAGFETPEDRYAVEVEDKAGEVVVRAEAPGFEAKDLEVEVRDEMLILHAVKETKKTAEKNGKGEDREESLCEFREVVELPGPVLAEKATAKYVNGVLTVTLPKAEEAKGRRVPVTAT
jgi:HSP20 family molecular chaperone IbpA